MKKRKINTQASHESSNKATDEGLILEEDKFANIPDAIILHILSFIDVKLAVQTSLLSKRWLHFWKCIPALNICTRQFPVKSSFEKFIRQFLKLHKATTIHSLKFTCVPWFYESLASDIVNHAFSRHVQHVDLGFLLRSGNPIQNCHLASKSLKTLKLANVDITEPSFNFPSLKTLSLRHYGQIFCNMDDEHKNVLVHFLSNCVSLENLELSHCYLQCYSDSDISKNGLQISFPSLKSLIFQRVNFFDNYIDSLPINLFSSFASLENLELRECRFQGTGDFIISSPQLANLKLSHLTWRRKNTQQLIVSTPTLAYLKLEFGKTIDIDLSIDSSTMLNTVLLHTHKYYCTKNRRNEQMEQYFLKLLNLFKGLSTAKLIYMSMDTIKVLSMFTDKLENQVCPLHSLENLKVQARSAREDFYIHISREVVRYLLSGSPKLKETAVILV